MGAPIHTARIVKNTLIAWLLIAVGTGAAGLLRDLRPPVPQLILMTLTFGGLLLLRLVAPYRAWIAAVDARVLVAFHLTRFVGFYFLILYSRGELPYAFAVLGGWGDIAVAALAIVLLARGAPHGRWRLAYVVWNVVGLADILFVVTTATRRGMENPESLVMNHLIHHRAQLGVYYRLCDVPVPAMYGPTADERGM